jgi:antitoxin VapB
MHTATLFQHDHHQAVQLPQELHFPGTAVYIKQVGNALVLLPMAQPWEPLLTSLALFSEDFMREREEPRLP